jgi:integrase
MLPRQYPAGGYGGAGLTPMAILTTKAIENAKPGAARREIADQASGVRLVIQPSGAKSWCVRYRFGGRSRKYTIGTYPAIGLADARRLAGKALARVAEGFDPGTERAAAKADTVEAVVELYLKRHVRERCRPRTVVEVERMLGRAVKAWRGRLIGSIRRRDVVAFLDDVLDVHGPGPANYSRASLSGLFRWALARDVVQVSPVFGVPQPAKEVPRERVLDDDELRAIWAAAGQLEYPAGPFVRFLILTACRRAEASAAEWSEIDLESRTWRLPAERSKNRRLIETPLSGLAYSILTELPRIGPGRFVFTVTGRKPIGNHARIKARLDELSGVRGWRLHDLRRSFATIAADQLGIAPHTVDACLGHAVGDRVSRTYNRARYLAEKAAAFDRWAAHIEQGPTATVVPLRSLA